MSRRGARRVGRRRVVCPAHGPRRHLDPQAVQEGRLRLGRAHAHGGRGRGRAGAPGAAGRGAGGGGRRRVGRPGQPALGLGAPPPGGAGRPAGPGPAGARAGAGAARAGRAAAQLRRLHQDRRRALHDPLAHRHRAHRPVHGRHADRLAGAHPREPHQRGAAVRRRLAHLPGEAGAPGQQAPEPARGRRFAARPVARARQPARARAGLDAPLRPRAPLRPQQERGAAGGHRHALHGALGVPVRRRVRAGDAGERAGPVREVPARGALPGDLDGEVRAARVACGRAAGAMLAGP